MAKTLTLDRGSTQVGHQADGTAGGLFEKLMHTPGRNEKHGAGANGVRFPSDALLPVTPEVKQKLPVRVPMWRVMIEGLEVAVDPQGPDRPVAAAQAQASQHDRLNRGGGDFSHQHNK
jgi:hypothetical protein